MQILLYFMSVHLITVNTINCSLHYVALYTGTVHGFKMADLMTNSGLVLRQRNTSRSI